MNEAPSAPHPPPAPEPPPQRPEADSSPGIGCTIPLGLALLVLSCLACVAFRSPAPFFVGALGALVSLFCKGWRGIFVGFVATIGLVYLALIVICGAMGNPHF